MTGRRHAAVPAARDMRQYGVNGWNRRGDRPTTTAVRRVHGGSRGPRCPRLAESDEQTWRHRMAAGARQPPGRGPAGAPSVARPSCHTARRTVGRPGAVLPHVGVGSLAEAVLTFAGGPLGSGLARRVVGGRTALGERRSDASCGVGELAAEIVERTRSRAPRPGLGTDCIGASHPRPTERSRALHRQSYDGCRPRRRSVRGGVRQLHRGRHPQ